MHIFFSFVLQASKRIFFAAKNKTKARFLSIRTHYNKLIKLCDSSFRFTKEMPKDAKSELVA